MPFAEMVKTGGRSRSFTSKFNPRSALASLGGVWVLLVLSQMQNANLDVNGLPTGSRKNVFKLILFELQI